MAGDALTAQVVRATDATIGTVRSGSGTQGIAAYADVVAVDLVHLAPDAARILVVAADRTTAQRLADDLLVPDADVLDLEDPVAWLRLRGTAPTDLVVVGLDPARWRVTVRALRTLTLHGGPLAVADTTGDHDPGGRERDLEVAEADRVGAGTGSRSDRWVVTVRTRSGARHLVVHRRFRPGWRWTAREAARPWSRTRLRASVMVRPSDDHGRPTIDGAQHNPIGWHRYPSPPRTMGVDDPLPVPGRNPRLVELRPTDDPRRSAERMLEFAARGIPVRLAAPQPDALGLLAPEVIRTLDAAVHQTTVRTSDPALDRLEVQAASIELRRAVLLEHDRTRLSAPAGGVPVTVVLVTQRPAYVRAAVARVLAQVHRPLELVLAANAPGVLEQLRAADLEDASDRGVAVTTLDVPAAEPLGVALAMATERASGDVVTKFDDDDLYAPTHVTDLVLALHTSGATVVGKGSEFVHLGGADVTIHRPLSRNECYSPWVAGGAIALHAQDLQELGGWARVPRAVDTRLLDAVRWHGGSIYRTHGFGFVFNRHGDGHTYPSDESHFLRGGEVQRPGLDLLLPRVAT